MYATKRFNLLRPCALGVNKYKMLSHSATLDVRLWRMTHLSELTTTITKLNRIMDHCQGPMLDSSSRLSPANKCFCVVRNPLLSRDRAQFWLRSTLRRKFWSFWHASKVMVGDSWWKTEYGSLRLIQWCDMSVNALVAMQRPNIKCIDYDRSLCIYQLLTAAISCRYSINVLVNNRIQAEFWHPNSSCPAGYLELGRHNNRRSPNEREWQPAHRSLLPRAVYCKANRLEWLMQNTDQPKKKKPQ